MSTDSRRDDVVGAAAVLILLIGTATGNAHALLAISLTAIVLLALFDRGRIGRGAARVAFVAAVAAAVIGGVATR